jgi:hypothetical protein
MPELAVIGNPAGLAVPARFADRRGASIEDDAECIGSTTYPLSQQPRKRYCSARHGNHFADVVLNVRVKTETIPERTREGRNQGPSYCPSLQAKVSLRLCQMRPPTSPRA